MKRVCILVKKTCSDNMVEVNMMPKVWYACKLLRLEGRKRKKCFPPGPQYINEIIVYPKVIK